MSKQYIVSATADATSTRFTAMFNIDRPSAQNIAYWSSFLLVNGLKSIEVVDFRTTWAEVVELKGEYDILTHHDTLHISGGEFWFSAMAPNFGAFIETEKQSILQLIEEIGIVQASGVETSQALISAKQGFINSLN